MLYLVKYIMIKFFKDIWKDFAFAQKEMQDSGMWIFVSHGMFYHLDYDIYNHYLKTIKDKKDSQ